MLNKKLLIPLIGLCLTGLIFGTYKAGTMASNAVQGLSLQQSKTVSSPLTPLIDTMEQEKEHARENMTIAETNVTPDVKSEPSKQQDQSMNDFIKESIAKGDIIEAKEGYTYAQKKIIVIDKKLIVALEGYRVVVDQSSYSTGKYYVMVVDFSILNGKSNFCSSLSNFVLSDSRDFTYSPTLRANTRGDISGVLMPGENKRGEIAFYVPGNETQFELSFKTGINAVKTIRFNFDTDSLINPPLANQQAPY